MPAGVKAQAVVERGNILTALLLRDIENNEQTILCCEDPCDWEAALSELSINLDEVYVVYILFMHGWLCVYLCMQLSTTEIRTNPFDVHVSHN